MNWWKNFLKRTCIVPIVRLDGVIGSSGQFGGGGLTDSTLAPVLEKAFGMSRIKAVALIINSPGGSPTQSSLIAARIKRISKEKNVPVIAFCEDVAASGGYWLACSAEEIYADENSIVGSIGVISASFGFHEFINRQGIERRVYTAGEDKSVLDPFRPEKKSDIQKIKKIQIAIHDNFKRYVAQSRGRKINTDVVCTGEFWDARKALELGLIDGVEHLEPLLKKRFGEKIKFKQVSRKKALFARLSKSMIDSIFGAVISKLYFGRFNL